MCIRDSPECRGLMPVMPAPEPNARPDGGSLRLRASLLTNTKDFQKAIVLLKTIGLFAPRDDRAAHQAR
eukprot:6590023-Alexandrium_andersonii.AAC.1